MYKKKAFIFPGQGSHYAGMGQTFYNDFHSVQILVEEAGDLLGLNIKDVLLHYTIDELEQSELVQTAIVIVGYCSFKVLTEEYGIYPDLLAGHSLGELSALACSGAITYKDTLALTRKREKIMNMIGPGQGGMIAVMGIDADSADKICKSISSHLGYVAVSNYNSDEQVTISGTEQALKELISQLNNQGVRILPVPVPGPYHSRLMESSLPFMKDELNKCDFSPLEYPVISSITGTLYRSEKEIYERLAIQLTNPVRWTQVLACFAEGGIKELIEIGPQSVLRNLSMTNCIDLTVLAIENRRDFQEILRRFSKVRELETVNSVSRNQLLNDCLKEALCAPNYNDDEKEFEQGFLKPYRKILSNSRNSEKLGGVPGYKEMKEALDMLHQALIIKKVADSERREIMQDVLYVNGLFDVYPDYLKMQV
ncbi:ACP S-malonyltransferase [Paenibacillus sp. FSL R7-0302]|uniref:ACP S-malonyltransferase n=1 Tax=Paenibacillus sp. FSL R7-0302 TaxID=2921681 RepID=UPI0030FC75F1